MKKRMILMLAGLLMGQVSGAHAAGTRRAVTLATEEKARQLTPDAVIPLCEKALVAALEGHDAYQAIAADIKGLSAEDQHFVLVICAVYVSGAVSALKHQAEAAKLPAGGTVI